MKFIIGLGNPGREYADTKHNVGFMAVDALAAKLGVTEWRQKDEALVAEVFGPEKWLLIKPQTYMNLSGQAVQALAQFYKVDTTDMTVIFDDMDLCVGKLRLRRKGTSGGHRGIQNMLDLLPNDQFNRIKIGIGRPKSGWTVVKHVLAPFDSEEKTLVEEAVKVAAAAAECILTKGMTEAMNQYNGGKDRA